GVLVERQAHVLEGGMRGVPGSAVAELALVVKLARVGVNGLLAERAQAAPDTFFVALEVAAVPLERLAQRAHLGVQRGDALAAVLRLQGGAQGVQASRAAGQVGAGPEGVEEGRAAWVSADLLEYAGDRADQMPVPVEDLLRGQAAVAAIAAAGLAPGGEH